MYTGDYASSRIHTNDAARTHNPMLNKDHGFGLNNRRDLTTSTNQNDSYAPQVARLVVAACSVAGEARSVEHFWSGVLKSEHGGLERHSCSDCFCSSEAEVDYLQMQLLHVAEIIVVLFARMNKYHVLNKKTNGQ